MPEANHDGRSAYMQTEAAAPFTVSWWTHFDTDSYHFMHKAVWFAQQVSEQSNCFVLVFAKKRKRNRKKAKKIHLLLCIYKSKSGLFNINASTNLFIISNCMRLAHSHECSNNIVIPKQQQFHMVFIRMAQC